MGRLGLQWFLTPKWTMSVCSTAGMLHRVPCPSSEMQPPGQAKPAAAGQGKACPAVIHLQSAGLDPCGCCLRWACTAVTSMTALEATAASPACGIRPWAGLAAHCQAKPVAVGAGEDGPAAACLRPRAVSVSHGLRLVWCSGLLLWPTQQAKHACGLKH